MWVSGCVEVGVHTKSLLRRATFGSRTLQPAMRLPEPPRLRRILTALCEGHNTAPPPGQRAAPSRCAESRMEGTGKREEVNMGGSEVLLGYRSLPDLDLRPAHGTPP